LITVWTERIYPKIFQKGEAGFIVSGARKCLGDLLNKARRFIWLRVGGECPMLGNTASIVEQKTIGKHHGRQNKKLLEVNTQYK
jgi:hypothetical protein